MSLVIEVPRGEHSPLGPSSSKRWILCPGSVKASVGEPDDESIYAANGTAAHYLSELCRKENKQAVAWLGARIRVGSYEFEVDEEMTNSVQEFVDRCEERTGIALVEQRIGYSNHFSPDVIAAMGPAFGTLDDARLNDSVINIIDFKHGTGVQEFAEWNTQLLLQALGVYEDYGYLYTIEGFWLSICQPRLDHFDRWYVSLDELLEWAKLIPGYGQKVMEGTEFKAGDHCKFCKIRRRCRVRAKAVMTLALAEDEFDDLDELEVHALRAQNRIQFLTNDDVAKILPALGDFKKWIKDIERLAIAELIAQKPVGEWKIVGGRSGRKWISAAEAAVKLESLELDPYAPEKVISVAVAEGKMGKKNFAQRFKHGEDFTKSPGRPTLAPGSDKRTAIDTSSINEFTDLDAADLEE